MMVDALMLLGENRFGPTLSVNEALGLCDELGFDAVVAAPARPMAYHLAPANEWLADAARENSGRLAALGRVDPLNGEEAIVEAARCLSQLECVGLFLHPGEEAFPITVARDVLGIAQQYGAPVVVATGYFSLSEPLQIAQLATDFPEVSVGHDHGGPNQYFGPVNG
jgi:predicted TIM-barrel fold metal-dependent hydrolase